METTKTTQDATFKTLLQNLQMEDALDRLEVGIEEAKQQKRKAQQATKEAQQKTKEAQQATKEAQQKTKETQQATKEAQQKTKMILLKFATYLVNQDLSIEEIVTQTGLAKTEIQKLKQSN